MAISKQEQKLLDCIKSFYDQPVFTSYRPDFLKNEKTGKNLEIDIYLKHHRIGFEYQGGTHFKDIKEYRNNSDDSRRTDNLKNDILESRIHDRMCIVEVFPDDLKGDIKQNIINRILITQEFYFNHGQFAKCRQLEQLYLFCMGVKHSGNVKFLEMCAKIKYTKFNKLKERFELIKALLLHRKQVKYFNGERIVFDINRISVLLVFDKFLKEREAA